MVATIEYNISQNIINMFGGNIILIGMAFIVVIVTIILLSKIPLNVATPIMLFSLLIAGVMIPGLIVFVALIGGAIIAYFIARLLSGG